MYGHFVVCFITIICLQLWSVDTLDSKHNILCQPLPQVVAVNGDGLPYFVVLQQCQGSIEYFHPQQKNCTFATYENVSVKITNGGQSGHEKYVTLKNHTSCKEQCAQKCLSDLFERNERCGCTCTHTKAPEGHECGKNKIWDSTNCKCKCNLKKDDAPTTEKLDEKQCKFVCNRKCRPGRKLDTNTCRCVPVRIIAPVANEADSDNSQQGKVLAALVIGEFVFLYLIFDFLLYSKKTGLMYYVRCKCRGKPSEESAQPQSESKPCLENGGEANNVPLRDVVVDCNGRSQVAQHVSST